MYKIRQSLYIGIEQMKEEFSGIRVWMGFLIGVVCSFLYSYNYSNYAGENVVQMFEPMILLLNDKKYATMLLLGYLLIVSSAPFVNSRTIYSIIRMDKKTWSNGMIVHIFLQTFLYYLSILLTSIATIGIKSYAGNIWSQSMYILAEFSPISALEKHGLSVLSPFLIQRWQPFMALGHSIVLVSLYSFTLATILFVLNLNFYKIWGSLVTLGVHFCSLVIISDSYIIPIKYSLFANALLINHDFSLAGQPSVEFSYFIFLGILFLLYKLLKYILRIADFKSSIGDKFL